MESAPNLLNKQAFDLHVGDVSSNVCCSQQIWTVCAVLVDCFCPVTARPFGVYL